MDAAGWRTREEKRAHARLSLTNLHARNASLTDQSRLCAGDFSFPFEYRNWKAPQVSARVTAALSFSSGAGDGLQVFPS